MQEAQKYLLSLFTPPPELKADLNSISQNPRNGFSRQSKLFSASLFFIGFSIVEISNITGIKQQTLYTWSKDWKKMQNHNKIADTLEARINLLIIKENKTDADFREIENLAKTLEKMARIESFKKSDKPSDLNPAIKERGEKTSKALAKNSAKKNYISDEQVLILEDYLKAHSFGHQLDWYEHSKTYNIRNYLKSRQIGATLYFAREALVTALKTGKNQIFLSASKNQSLVFKRNIQNFTRQAIDLELQGNPIILKPSGAELHFLATNASTAQAYSGDLYIDEYFWIKNFAELEKVASAMATLKDRRITYFSTPSVKTHQAYPLWSGAEFNTATEIKIKTDHATLKDGVLGVDNTFRQMVTLQDTVDKGYDLVDIDELRKRYPPGKFAQLFECAFGNDDDSIFKFAELQECMVDISKWQDFNPYQARPFGDSPVWIGYDPSRFVDDSSLAVLAPPKVKGGKFRILEIYKFNNLDFDSQAKKIRAMLARFNVAHIAIDTSGLGQAVYELVKKFYPQVKAITYSIGIKNQLVLKAKQIISHKRLEFDAGLIDVAQAFLTIRQESTGAGSVTFKASRTESTGHADTAWAIMHALAKEPLDAIEETGHSKRSFVSIF